MLEPVFLREINLNWINNNKYKFRNKTIFILSSNKRKLKFKVWIEKKQFIISDNKNNLQELLKQVKNFSSQIKKILIIIVEVILEINNFRKVLILYKKILIIHFIN
jgi:hypothetical protein